MSRTRLCLLYRPLLVQQRAWFPASSIGWAHALQAGAVRQEVVEEEEEEVCGVSEGGAKEVDRT